MTDMNRRSVLKVALGVAGLAAIPAVATGASPAAAAPNSDPDLVGVGDTSITLEFDDQLRSRVALKGVDLTRFDSRRSPAGGRQGHRGVRLPRTPDPRHPAPPPRRGRPGDDRGHVQGRRAQDGRADLLRASYRHDRDEGDLHQQVLHRTEGHRVAQRSPRTPGDPRRLLHLLRHHVHGPPRLGDAGEGRLRPGELAGDGLLRLRRRHPAGDRLAPGRGPFRRTRRARGDDPAHAGPQDGRRSEHRHPGRHRPHPEAGPSAQHRHHVPDRPPGRPLRAAPAVPRLHERHRPARSQGPRLDLRAHLVCLGLRARLHRRAGHRNAAEGARGRPALGRAR